MTARKILLIDDDRFFSQVVAKALDPTKYLVTYASSGPEGLVKAMEDPPDLILLDVMMPEMDGYQVCNQLRQNTSTANVPVIMITALDEIGEKVRGLRVGADDYITKPCDLQELQTRVQVHLRRSTRDLSASPLTYLPGNPVIEQVLTRRLAENHPVAMLYLDLNNFKAFNDQYGWLQGDEIIKLLARVVRDVVDRCGTRDDFIGHIGGDDFLVLSIPERAPVIAEQVISEFEALVSEYYRPEDRARGYFEAIDHDGKPIRILFVSLKIAIVTNKRRKLTNPSEAATLAAQVKEHLKRHTGSHFAYERHSK